MALIKCSECGQDVSDKASACPHCGCPVNASASNKSPSNCAQIRVLCKTSSLTIDQKPAYYGNIVNVDVGEKGHKLIRMQAVGGEIGLIMSGIERIVVAGHKYDLDVHHTLLLGRMLRLQEVGVFM